LHRKKEIGEMRKEKKKKERRKREKERKGKVVRLASGVE
jgi:hypothetical protein